MSCNVIRSKLRSAIRCTRHELVWGLVCLPGASKVSSHVGSLSSLPAKVICKKAFMQKILIDLKRCKIKFSSPHFDRNRNSTLLHLINFYFHWPGEMTSDQMEMTARKSCAFFST